MNLIFFLQFILFFAHRANYSSMVGNFHFSDILPQTLPAFVRFFYDYAEVPPLILLVLGVVLVLLPLRERKFMWWGITLNLIFLVVTVLVVTIGYDSV